MRSISDFDRSRRQVLLYALSTGTLASTFSTLSGCTSPAIQTLSSIPTALTAGQSIYQLAGNVTVNGTPATLKTPIHQGDTIETATNSFAIFVVEKDAFILRSDSTLALPKKTFPAQSTVPLSNTNGFNLTKGKMLTVLASRKTLITTPSAIIGIRGTGIYIEVEPELSYVCTCYGTVDIATSDDSSISETVQAQHHDAPKYIFADKSKSNRIQPAPFKDHDDQELLLIETLVGRTTPYFVPKSVTRSRHRYY